MINKVISVCRARDIEVWEHAAPAILANIAADVYEVAVPDKEVSAFEAASPAGYLVVPESKYLEERNFEWLRSRLPEHLRVRTGWYLQQFVKIAAIAAAAEDDVVLIWDADTIPTRKLRFVEDGKLVYHTGREHHRDYFLTIATLIRLPKLADFSFIAQCFPARAMWIKQMCSDIEDLHRAHWIEAIVTCLHSAQSSFSEYETMGTYVYRQYPENLTISSRRWFRHGRRLLGSPRRLAGIARTLVAHRYDYISFENWDTKGPGLRDTIKNWRKWAELVARYILRA